MSGSSFLESWLQDNYISMSLMRILSPKGRQLMLSFLTVPLEYHNYCSVIPFKNGHERLSEWTEKNDKIKKKLTILNHSYSNCLVS